MPLVDLFFAMIWFFLWVAWIVLLIRVIGDIFRSDRSGASKALWCLLVIVLPLIGVLAYLMTNGEEMTVREVESAQAAARAQENYLRDVAGTSTADELSKLAALRDQGVLTDDEFATQKARVLA